MARVFLTGGSGYVAAHVLNKLLEQGYSVVTTVRSDEKAKKIFALYPNVPKSKLDVVVVEDMSQASSFDKAIVSDPPFEVVIHTASPYRFDAKDVKTELLDPAIVGTTGILESVKKFAPSVKRVVITSSTVAVLDTTKGNRPGYTYSEADWNPVTEEMALSNPFMGYFGSKTLAERAAWKFVESEKPNFTLTTLNPPAVLGPVINGNLKALNTSHWFLLDLLTGKHKNGEIPSNLSFPYVDVRDLAVAHVNAIDAPEAAGSRFIIAEGTYTNRKVVEAIQKHFPEYRDQLPAADAKGGDLPKDGMFEIDHTKRQKLVGKEMIHIEECIVDMVKSFKELGI